MEELPAPLTVIKRSAFSDRKVSSLSLAYPQIPSRSSSLSMTVNHNSNEAATSTRTPSLTDSHYNIEIAKLRSDASTAAKRNPTTGQYADDEPWVDNVNAYMPSYFVFLLIY